MKITEIQGFLVFIPEELLYSASNNTVRVWDAESAKEVARLEGHSKTVTSVAVSADGRGLRRFPARPR